MGYLDNSGDIILDVVLTDAGRVRLAKGDGMFKIAKFALGDDEIDYERYDQDHPSGSAYYDLEIMQAPILEAFTNNMSSMKHKLISISRTNLLYLPVMKLNEIFEPGTKMFDDADNSLSGFFLCAVDSDTEDALRDLYPSWTDGILRGEFAKGGSYVRVDQGLDTDEIPPNYVIDGDLIETQYIVEIDNRFGSIVSASSAKPAAVSYIDDDSVASYYLSLGTDLDYISENEVREEDPGQTIAGPRGTYLQFRIRASLELNTSEYLFNQVGAEDTMTLTKSLASGVVTRQFVYIDSVVRVSGATTGYSIDIPIRFAKVTS